MQGWRDRFRDWRNRLVGDPAFQRFAAGMPIVRRISARQARRLFDITAGFVYSQVLYSLVRTGILTYLADGPRTTAEVARFCGIAQLPIDSLLRAAAELDLLVPARHDDRWRLADLGAVVASNPGIRAMVLHHAMLYADLGDPVALLRGDPAKTATGRFWSYAGASEPAAQQDTEAYSELMALSQDLIIDEVFAAYRLGRHREILDIGGGEGRFLLAAGKRYPQVRLRLFDLPAVTERVRCKQQDGLVPERLQLTGGDFFNDDLPAGADLITLIRVVCDHDDEPAQALLSRIRAVMQPGHTLLIAEPMGGAEGRAGGAAAYFGMYFLAMRSGRSRTPSEVRQLLRRAGFRSTRLLKARQPLLASVIVAHA